VGAASAGGCAAGAGVCGGSVVRCGGGGRVRAGVHRPPVRARRRLVGAAGDRGVATGGRWAGAAGGPEALRVDAGAGGAVAAGGGAVAAPDHGGDAGAGGRAGPVSGWSAAVWVSVGGCGTASESGARRVGASAAAVGSGPGDGAACAVDVRRASDRALRALRGS